MLVLCILDIYIYIYIFFFWGGGGGGGGDSCDGDNCFPILNLDDFLIIFFF